MVLDPREDSFNGSVEITVNFETVAEGFYLHGQGLNIHAVGVRTGDETVQSPAQWVDVLDSGVAYIDFGKEIASGEVVVTISYDAPFDTNLSGMFKVTEQGDSYALAKSESIQARRYMPGFDQPAFKAPFDVTLTIPEDYVAITNSLEISRKLTGSGHERIEFATTRPIPTYLLSLAVGPFDVVEVADMPANDVRSASVPLTGYARRGKGAELAYVLETTPELIRLFEQAYKYPYPYEKLDIIAAPQWPSGATELAAAITYRESRILAGSDMGPAARRGLLSIHAHELGHSWFGNLVTPPWWDDLWLKEAFASWGEGWVLAQFEDDPGYQLDAIADGIRAMGLDSLGAARAVHEPIVLNENIRNAYDAITYNKGQAVIGMVDAYFGAEVFRPALGRYVAKFEDGVAGSAQFYEVIGETLGEVDTFPLRPIKTHNKQVTDVFRSFVEQGGLPLVKVSLASGGDGEPQPFVTQSRYAPLGSEINPDRLWTLPLCYNYPVDDAVRRKCQLLMPRSRQIPLIRSGISQTTKWIMPNAGGTGYWRFSMPYEMWQDLGRAFDQLVPGEQLSTLDSAGAEFAAGRLDVQTVWRFIDEGARVDERRVVAAAIAQAERFERHVAGDAVALAGYRAALSDVFASRLQQLDGADSEDAAILRTGLQRLLARTARDTQTRAGLSDAAATFIGMPGAASERVLSSDDFMTAMAVGLQDGGAPFLDRLLQARTEIDDPTFEQAVAFAIGENDDPDLSARILALALSGELGSRESLTIVAGQMRQPAVQALTWDWFQANYAAFVEVIPRQRRRLTPNFAAGLCSVQGREALDALFVAHGSLAPGYERALAQTSEQITLCAALEAGKGQEVRAYFSQD